MRKAIYVMAIVGWVGMSACVPRWPSEPMRLGGWITYWDFKNGVNSMSRPPGMLILNDVFFFTVQLNSEGIPVFTDPDTLHNQAITNVMAHKKMPWMTVVNDVISTSSGTSILKDPNVVHAILIDSDRRKLHQQQIVSLAVAHGFLGVDIDYENLFLSDRAHFSQFIKELAVALKAEGLSLSVTVQPTLKENASDWVEICRVVDRLQIMLYNLHSTKTGPGPMATPEWILKILKLTEKKCPFKKIVPILKVSGMRWGPTRVDGIQYDQARALAEETHAMILRDPNGNVPYFTYSTAEGMHTVFYEDTISLLEKVHTLKALGYKKVVLWSLGREDPTLLPSLAEASEKGHPLPRTQE